MRLKMFVSSAPSLRAGAGDFSLAFDGGLTLAYADADRTCYLTFTDDAMSGAAPADTSSWMRPAAARIEL